MGKKTVSGSMHGEKFWKQEANNVGMKMMKDMGWDRGSGLGQNNDGQQEAIRVTKKQDRVGIGATDTTDGMYYSAMNDVFNNLLNKLNKKKDDGANGGEAAKKSEEEPEDPVSMAASIKKASSKRRLYSKFIKAKDASGYSEADKAKIFGSAGRKKEKETKEDFNDNGVEANMSMADYFKQKMAAAQGGSSGEAPRRSPRLAGSSPSMGGLGLGAGSMASMAAAANAANEEGNMEEEEAPQTKKRKKKSEEVDEAETEKKDKKKKKKKKAESEEEEDEAVTWDKAAKKEFKVLKAKKAEDGGLNKTEKARFAALKKAKAAQADE